MANKDNENGWSTALWIAAAIILIWGWIGSKSSKKQSQQSTQVVSNNRGIEELKRYLQQRNGNNTSSYSQQSNTSSYPQTQRTVTHSSNTYYTPNPNYSSFDDASRNEYWKEWDDTDFRMYVELENCESLDEAQEYDYSAIEEDDRYFVPKSIPSGNYEVEVIEKVNSYMWRLNHSNIFLKFRFNPFLYKWDKGVIETFAGKGTFYKKP